MMTFHSLLKDHSSADSQLVLCIVRDITNPQWNRCKITINLQEHVSVQELCEEIARQANYEPDTFNLVWQKGGNDGQEVMSVDFRFFNYRYNESSISSILDISSARMKPENSAWYTEDGQFNRIA